MSIFRIFFFTFKFRTVNNAGFWLAKNSSPRCPGKYDQRVTAKCLRITSHNAVRAAVMSDDAENMASSMTPLKWEGWCFSLSYSNSSLPVRSVKLFLRYKRLSSISGLFLSCLELRKKARQLENEIDLKLVSFSKLGTSYSHHNGFRERCLLDSY